MATVPVHHSGTVLVDHPEAASPSPQGRPESNIVAVPVTGTGPNPSSPHGTAEQNEQSSFMCVFITGVVLLFSLFVIALAVVVLQPTGENLTNRDDVVAGTTSRGPGPSSSGPGQGIATVPQSKPGPHPLDVHFAAHTTGGSLRLQPVNPVAKTFSRGKLYYRSAYLDDKGGHLFVGAMDKLFKLPLDDISSASHKELELTAAKASINSCKIYLGERRFGTVVDCRNHIREVHPIRDGSTLYICGTGARNPTDWQVRAGDLTLVPEPEQVFIGDNNKTGGATGRCPYYLHQDTTSLWLDDVPVPNTSSVVGLSLLSSPNGYAFYRTAAYSGSNKNKPLHDYLRTTTSEETIALNQPHALGAFTRGERVYFVFREETVERRACGVKNVSGLARFCKNDIGHKQLGKGTQWTSFTKVRLQCNDKTEPVFPFDDMHGSAYVPDMDDGVLFGSFVGNAHGSTDSAICAFRWKNVEEAFKSSFVKLPKNDKYELGHPVPANELPGKLPGGDCPPDPNVHAFETVSFLQGHPLLMDPAKPRHDRPFYARRGLEFKSLAAFVLTESWGSWVVCYVATAEGIVLKIAERYQPNGPAPAPAVMVDAFNVTREPILKMLVSLKRRSLYVFSDDAVRQYRLDACEGRHFECAACVLDPFCGWDGKRCLPHTTGGAATTARKC